MGKKFPYELRCACPTVQGAACQKDISKGIETKTCMTVGSVK